MKKTIYSKLLATLFVVVSGMMFTSCGDDNDEPNGNDNAKWNTSYEVKVTFGEDMFKMADITAHIAQPNGKVTSEPVLKASSSWKLTGDKIPDKAGILFTFVPKKDVTPDNLYRVEIYGSITATSFKNGVEFSSQPRVYSNSMSIKGSQVEKYFTDRAVALVLSIDEDGDVNYANAEDFDFGLNGFWKWLAGVLPD